MNNPRVRAVGTTLGTKLVMMFSLSIFAVVRRKLTDVTARSKDPKFNWYQFLSQHWRKQKNEGSPGYVVGEKSEELK